MKLKISLNALLGIGTEIIYALTIILAGFFMCLALYFRK
jgi:hypothetical protein